MKRTDLIKKITGLGAVLEPQNTESLKSPDRPNRKCHTSCCGDTGAGFGGRSSGKNLTTENCRSENGLELHGDGARRGFVVSVIVAKLG